jgi:hypothetical protein
LLIQSPQNAELETAKNVAAAAVTAKVSLGKATFIQIQMKRRQMGGDQHAQEARMGKPIF